MLRNDGVVIYLNGVVVALNNLIANASYSHPASSQITSNAIVPVYLPGFAFFFHFASFFLRKLFLWFIAASSLTAITTIAVEVHKSAAAGDVDMFFDLELIATVPSSRLFFFQTLFTYSSYRSPSPPSQPPSFHQRPQLFQKDPNGRI